jgi:uncharacterized protein (DUF2249 family)/CRP-like cAMP-binding protein
MQSTGQTSTQPLSLVPMQGSVMTYGIVSAYGVPVDPAATHACAALREKADSMLIPDLDLDVRSIPPAKRHPKIFALFASLRAGQTLVLISDHEPRPLRAEFEQTQPGLFTWDQRRLGDGRWETRIARAASCSPLSGDVQATLLRSVIGKAPGSALGDLAHYVRRAAIKRHHCVAEQGVLWPYVGIVESGIVQAQLVTQIGREQAMYDVLPGELFAETALLDRGHVALRHVALTADTVVLLLPIERMRALADRDLAIAHRPSPIEETAAQHTRAILARFAAQIALSSTARVASILLAYAGPMPGLTSALDPLPTMTQVELATSAGTVREMVSRALAELETIGAVHREAGHLVQLDRSKLIEAIERG